jgi:hypothetical protein
VRRRPDLQWRLRADEGNRTPMTTLEGRDEALARAALMQVIVVALVS